MKLELTLWTLFLFTVINVRQKVRLRVDCESASAVCLIFPLQEPVGHSGQRDLLLLCLLQGEGQHR